MLVLKRVALQTGGRSCYGEAGPLNSQAGVFGLEGNARVRHMVLARVYGE